MAEFSKDDEKIISPTRQMMIKFHCNRLAMLGLYVFLSLVLVILFAKVYTIVTHYDFTADDYSLRYLAPSLEYPFGTDGYGRGMWMRVWAGGWISIQVGILATLISVVIGVVVGSVSGFFGGIIDTIIMRATEIVSSFPFLAIALTLSFIFIDLPEQTRLDIMIMILGFLRWTALARMVRGQILSLREEEFMLAARALGIKRRNQILRHLIPNVTAYLVVYGTLAFASAILLESTLSFLGLSVSEPVPTWGSLLSRAASSSTNMRQYWWTWIYPGFMLFLLIMSINVVGEGLRDAIDPKTSYITSKERKRLKQEKKMLKQQGQLSSEKRGA